MPLDMLFGVWGTLAVLLGFGCFAVLGFAALPRLKARRERKISSEIDMYAHKYRRMSPRARELYRGELVVETYGFFRNQDAINRCHAAMRVLNEERIGVV